MLGGELLATGSSSCVFNPNFPCKRSGVVDDERISKIIYNPGAKEESQHEKKMNEAIQKIRGYSSWAIIFDQFCKTAFPAIQYRIGHKTNCSILQCFHEIFVDFI